MYAAGSLCCCENATTFKMECNCSPSTAMFSIVCFKKATESNISKENIGKLISNCGLMAFASSIESYFMSPNPFFYTLLPIPPWDCWAPLVLYISIVASVQVLYKHAQVHLPATVAIKWCIKHAFCANFKIETVLL